MRRGGLEPGGLDLRGCAASVATADRGSPVIALLAALATTPAPADPLAPHGVYEGSWRMQTESLDTEFSKVGKTGHVLTNRCQKSDRFYACAQKLDGTELALIVFTWDAAARSYVSYPIGVGGGAAGKGRLEIVGDTWTFPWDQSKDGVTIHFRVVNVFKGHDRIAYRQEFSRDGQAWIVSEHGTETRIIVKP